MLNACHIRSKSTSDKLHIFKYFSSCIYISPSLVISSSLNIQGDDNSLNEHSWKAHSMSPVNLADIEILEATEFDLLLIQVHGKFKILFFVFST